MIFHLVVDHSQGEHKFRILSDHKAVRLLRGIVSKIDSQGSSVVAQWVKDPALLLQWLGSLLWHTSVPGQGTSTWHGYGQKKKLIVKSSEYWEEKAMTLFPPILYSLSTK